MTEVGASPQSSDVDAVHITAAPDLLAALYQNEVGWVWNALRRLGAPSADVEDLAHDVFLAAHRSQARFDPSRPTRPWLMGIAFRVLSDFRRQKRHHVEVPGDVLPDAAADHDLEGVLADRQARLILMRALDGLEPDRRAVLVAHDLEGLSMPQIAEAFDVPLNTAYSRLRLARENLARAVAALQPAGGAG